MRQRLLDIYYSFPVQLLRVHFRSNLLFVVLWLVLVLMMSGQLGQRVGLLFLFLDPEYLGRVNFWSYLFVGIAFGSFFMSWNLTIYLLNAHHFPFLASLSRPFTKFCINNGLLPLAFFVYYLGMIVFFGKSFEGLSFQTILIHCSGLICGVILLVAVLSVYFSATNHDIFYYVRRKRMPHPYQESGHIAPGRRKIDIEYVKQLDNRWKVHTYLGETLKPRLVRSVAHYDTHLLLNIFKQNHLNALVLQLLGMLALMSLGLVVNNVWFRIPAAASIFVLISVITAITGAITYWFDEWRALIFIFLLAGVNYLTSFDHFKMPNRAYGLHYDNTPATYSVEHFRHIIASEQVPDDIRHTQHILDSWSRRVQKNGNSREKPKLVVLCASGGGLRSTVWTMQVMKTADSLLSGRLLNHTVLITGASGGMLGMAYLRELYLRKQQGENINLYDETHIEDLSQDLLNSLAFTLISNDLFLPWATMNIDGQKMPKDRAYIFEQQLGENACGMLNKRLGDYAEPERDALIPLLFLTPSVVNDGRRMIISPQGVSYMMSAPMAYHNPQALEVDAVDFGNVFKQQNAQNLRFLSALRMNATYPYLLPNVHLPSAPEIEVMDAGFRDNYGMMSATRFLQVFREWIKEHTSGVVVVQISSSELIEEIPASSRTGVISALGNPLGIAGKLFTVQEFEHGNSIGLLHDLLEPVSLEVIRFIYYPASRERLTASVSFHLTRQEKTDILRAIQQPDNRQSLQKLKGLLSGNHKE